MFLLRRVRPDSSVFIRRGKPGIITSILGPPLRLWLESRPSLQSQSFGYYRFASASTTGTLYPLPIPSLENDPLDTDNRVATLTHLLGQVRTCQDAVDTSTTHKVAVDQARKNLMAQRFTLGFVRLGQHSVYPFFRCLFDNPLTDPTIRNTLAKLYEPTVDTVRPIVYSYHDTIQVVDTPTKVECGLPVDWLKRSNLQLVDCRDLVMLEDEHMLDVDALVLINDCRHLPVDPEERRLLTHAVANRPCVTLVQDNAPLSGSASCTKEQDLVRTTLESQGLSLLRTIVGASCDDAVVIPVATKLAMSAQDLLRASAQNAPDYERGWNASHAASVKEHIRGYFNPTHQASIRQSNVQAVLLQALGNLDGTIVQNTKLFRTLQTNLQALSQRVNTQYTTSLEKDLEQDLDSLMRDLERTRAQVNAVLQRLSFTALLWKSSRITELLLEALQSNCLRESELRMIYTAGKLNNQLHRIVRQVHGEMAHVLPLFKKWLQWRHQETDIQRLYTRREQLTHWTQTHDLVNPFTLSTLVWKYQSRSEHLKVVDQVTLAIERTSLTGVLLQVLAGGAGLGTYFIMGAIETAVGGAGLLSICGLLWTYFRWHQLGRLLHTVPEQAAVQLRQDILSHYRETVHHDILNPLTVVVDDLLQISHTIEVHTKEMHHQITGLKDLTRRVGGSGSH
ncbi:hypothetical protein IWQ61_004191 [Dispira simplex]|nr:hypothetical protein IWQ61_004191 [Dispira simplex]